MSSDSTNVTIRRILVAIDGSSHSLAAIDAAAELAARLNAELAGLFVEDINLLRLAGLPFAREVRFTTGEHMAVSESGMQRQLRAMANQARCALGKAATRCAVGWSFRVVRGKVAPEVLAAARDADLLTLGLASRPITGGHRVGSTAREAARRAPGAVLLLQTGSTMGLPIMVVFDGSTPAFKALQVAAKMSRKGPGEVTVLVVADNPDTFETLRQQASELLMNLDITAEFQLVADQSSQRLVNAVDSRGGGVLVVACSPLLPEDEIQHIVDSTSGPVLLVR